MCSTFETRLGTRSTFYERKGETWQQAKNQRFSAFAFGRGRTSRAVWIFVADNEAIESQLGGHIQNDNLHLNDTRRKRLDTPTEVRTYTGTGAASRTILFGFSPSAVIVFAVDKPFSQATTGCTKQYAGIAADGQNSLGVTLSTAQVTVRQTQTAPTDGSGMASLNESGVTYAVLAFR